MRSSDKQGKHSSLYLISDDFFTVMKRHHTLLLFMAHYMSMCGSRLILDEVMYDYLIKHVGINRANIKRFLRELESVGALKRAGFTYYIHPDIFYRGKWSERGKFFSLHKFDMIDKVIFKYNKLKDKLAESNVKRRSKTMAVVKKMNG
jgi:hypothetical protein